MKIIAIEEHFAVDHIGLSNNNTGQTPVNPNAAKEWDKLLRDFDDFRLPDMC